MQDLCLVVNSNNRIIECGSFALVLSAACQENKRRGSPSAGALG